MWSWCLHHACLPPSFLFWSAGRARRKYGCWHITLSEQLRCSLVLVAHVHAWCLGSMRQRTPYSARKLMCRSKWRLAYWGCVWAAQLCSSIHVKPVMPGVAAFCINHFFCLWCQLVVALPVVKKDPITALPVGFDATHLAYLSIWH